MDVLIKLDHSEATFSNGETISGNIVIYCPSTVTLSKITARLIGESEVTLTNTTGLMNWKQQEKHRFVDESQAIVPTRYRAEESKQEHWRLPFGYHSFDFGLQIPESPESCSCPPNSPVSLYSDDQESQPRSSRNLPPSMSNLINGVDVSYRIEVTMTTIRNIFKFTTKKAITVNIWPIDTQPRSITTISSQSFPCVKRIEASIMGPSNRLPAAHKDLNDSYLISTVDEPAKILISARFLKNFHLTRDRNMTMRLTVEKLNAFPHNLYLQSFQMLLVGYTDIRVGTATNREVSSWTIQSLSNLNTKIFTALNDGHTEQSVDIRLWEGMTLPESVVPSFRACNLARRYELELLMGFQCRGPRDKAGRVLFVQLRTPVRVSSGIFPGRQIVDPNEDLMGDEVPLTFREEAPSTHDESARGLGQQGPPGYDAARFGYTGPSLPLEPPTYDEAIMISMNERLAEEKNLVIRGW